MRRPHRAGSRFIKLRNQLNLHDSVSCSTGGEVLGLIVHRQSVHPGRVISANAHEVLAIVVAARQCSLFPRRASGLTLLHHFVEYCPCRIGTKPL